LEEVIGHDRLTQHNCLLVPKNGIKSRVENEGFEYQLIHANANAFSLKDMPLME